LNTAIAGGIWSQHIHVADGEFRKASNLTRKWLDMEKGEKTIHPANKSHDFYFVTLAPCVLDDTKTACLSVVAFL
jgi:hypothetical protein